MTEPVVTDPFLALGNEPQSKYIRSLLAEKGLGPSEAGKLSWGLRAFPVPHEYLRLEMSRLDALTNPELLAAGRHRAAAVAAFYGMVKPIVHSHHETEEKLWFPEMTSKFEVPDKASADHATLLKLLDEVSDRISACEAAAGGDGARAAADALRDTVSRLVPLFDEHLMEEESIMGPKMEEHFDEAWYNSMVGRTVGFLQEKHGKEVAATELAGILIMAEKWGGDAVVSPLYESLPPPLRDVARHVWIPSYQERIEAIFDAYAADEPVKAPPASGPPGPPEEAH